MITPEGRTLADAELAKTDVAIAEAKERTEAWLRTTLSIPQGDALPKIPYWNSDLKYPDHGANEDAWWNIRKIAPHNRTAEQQQFFDEHRYDGLTTKEAEQFQFAKQIRDHMVGELRKEQRINGDLPPEFNPVMARTASQSASPSALDYRLVDERSEPQAAVQQASEDKATSGSDNTLLPPRLGTGIDEPPVPSYRAKDGLWFPKRWITTGYSEEEIAKASELLQQQYVLGQLRSVPIS